MSRKMIFINIEEYEKHIQKYVKEKHPESYPLTKTQIKSIWKRHQKMEATHDHY